MKICMLFLLVRLLSAPQFEIRALQFRTHLGMEGDLQKLIDLVSAFHGEPRGHMALTDDPGPVITPTSY